MPSSPTPFLDALPAGVATSTEQLDRFRVNDVEPSVVARPESIEQLSACLAAAAKAEARVVAVGCATQLDFGRPPLAYDVALATDGLNRVIAHEAADLTVTVEAGITLAALNAQLAAHQQYLALDPPHPESATIGAILATDSCGPSRYSQGKARDLLIGVTAGRSDGKIVKGGGRVVKNVAGYDLMKVFIGSHGTLGVITSASFKLKPLPTHRAMVVVSSDDFADSLSRCLRWRDAAIEPMFLEALDGEAARQCGLEGNLALIGFAGSEREVTSQVDELRRLQPAGTTITGDASFARAYERIRDFRCAGDAKTWVAKVSVATARLSAAIDAVRTQARQHEVRCAVSAHAGNGVAWIRLDHGEPSRAAKVIAAVRDRGIACVLSRVPASEQSSTDPWGTMPAMALQAGIKRALDPDGRFSPGRLTAS